MRALLISLMLLSASFSSFGYSRITIERFWTIESDGGPYEFTGAISINDSNQKVISVTVPAGADYYQDGNGTIWVHSESSGGEKLSVIRASAIVDIDYDTNITWDPPVPGKELDTTELTEFNKEMSRQALSLAREDSSLTTITNLVNWVHGSVDYDLSYWGRIRSAREVFNERKGVCVEYTHLLISLARSLGFETRYVNGYVLANAWQPHAWAEIYLPGYGWLPADATFGQAGILDDTHIAIDYGDDQASAYDLLVTRDAEAKISVGENIKASFLSEDAKGVGVNISYEEPAVDVEISNSRPEYVLGAYSFQIPEIYGTSESSVMLLSPGQAAHRYYAVNRSAAEGLADIPVSASFNDARDSERIPILYGPGAEGLRSVCAPAFALAILLFKLFR